jgi:hypothetical protein
MHSALAGQPWFPGKTVRPQSSPDHMDCRLLVSVVGQDRVPRSEIMDDASSPVKSLAWE